MFWDEKGKLLCSCDRVTQERRARNSFIRPQLNLMTAPQLLRELHSGIRNHLGIFKIALHRFFFTQRDRIVNFGVSVWYLQGAVITVVAILVCVLLKFVSCTTNNFRWISTALRTREEGFSAAVFILVYLQNGQKVIQFR